MPGLLNQQIRPPVQPQAQQQRQAQGQQPSPEQQDQHKILVSGAIRLMHGKARDDIIKSLGAGDPVQTVANEAVKIIERLEHEATQAGNPVDPRVLLGGAQEIIENVIELGVTAGAIEQMGDSQKIEVAKYAAGLYMQNAQQSGKVSQQDMQALAGGA